MNYKQIFWTAGDDKMKKSKLLSKNIERNKEDYILNDIHSNSIYNTSDDIDMFNFRETIEINIENKTSNRDLLEKRLSSREKMQTGNWNPYLRCDKYLEDLSNENNFLRPKNTNFMNVKQ